METNGVQPKSPEQRFWYQDYALILLKRKGIIWTFLLAVVIPVMLYSFLAKPTYEARGSIWIEKETNILSFQDVFQLEAGSTDYYQSQYKLLQSRTLADATIEKLKLYDDPHFRGRRDPKAPGTPASDIVLREHLINRFLGRIEVNPVQATRIVEVRFSDSDPRFASETLNALFDAYVDLNITRKYQASEQASTFLTGQIKAVRSEIEANERKLQEYGEAKNIVPLSNQETTIVGRLAEINKALTSATVDRVKKQTYYNEISGASLSDIPQALNNTLIQRLREEYARLSRDYAGKLESLKPEYPEMQQLKTALDSAQGALKTELDNLIRGAYSDYQAALKNEDSLRSIFEAQKREAFDLNSDSISYNSLKVEIDNKKSLLEALLTRQSELDVSSRLRGVRASNIWIVDKASVPVSPASPRKMLNLFLALVTGLVGGVGLALIFEHVTGSIKTARDIERATGLPTIGIIPSLDSDRPPQNTRDKIKLLQKRWKAAGTPRKLPVADWPARLKKLMRDPKAPAPETTGSPRSSSVDLIANRHPHSILTENYRSIRTTLLVSSPPGKIKSILFTSPLAREGKSTTVSNLGVILTQANKKVVLVDSDLRKPRQGKIFGLNSNEGLSTYLTSLTPFSTLVKPTDIPNLSVINSGPVPENPIELLDSEKMDDLVAILRRTYDYVLFDAPPILVVSDAIAMGPMIDGVILIAWGGRTTLPALRQAKHKLDAHRIKCLGVILNGVNIYQQEGYYIRQYYQYYK